MVASSGVVAEQTSLWWLPHHAAKSMQGCPVVQAVWTVSCDSCEQTDSTHTILWQQLAVAGFWPGMYS